MTIHDDHVRMVKVIYALEKLAAPLVKNTTLLRSYKK